MSSRCIAGRPAAKKCRPKRKPVQNDPVIAHSLHWRSTYLKHQSVPAGRNQHSEYEVFYTFYGNDFFPVVVKPGPFASNTGAPPGPGLMCKNHCCFLSY